MSQWWNCGNFHCKNFTLCSRSDRKSFKKWGPNLKFVPKFNLEYFEVHSNIHTSCVLMMHIRCGVPWEYDRYFHKNRKNPPCTDLSYVLFSYFLLLRHAIVCHSFVIWCMTTVLTVTMVHTLILAFISKKRLTEKTWWAKFVYRMTFKQSGFSCSWFFLSSLKAAPKRNHLLSVFLSFCHRNSDKE